MAKSGDRNQKYKILIVDDEKDLLESIAFQLKHRGYQTATAENGKIGIEQFEEFAPSLIISDIRMPKMDGVTFLQEIKKKNPEFPFILMTGFAEILETKSAYELGADGFLAKPFSMKEMNELIENLLSGKDQDQLTDTSLYHPLNIKDFLLGSKISFPIYARLSDEKFIKIAHKGEDLNQSRIEDYIKKGVHELYLLKTDYKAYVDTLKKMTAVVQTNRVSLTQNTKVQVLKAANSVVMDDVFSKDLDSEVFDEGKEMFESTLNVATEMSELFDIITSLSKKAEKLYAHSVCVSMFTMMLLKKMGWISPANKTNAGLGAMFHDIGKKALPDWLLEKKLIDLNYEERKQLEQHTVLGAQTLQQVGGVTDEIIKIALQHHETCLGTGYPNGLSRSGIHPLAKIVAIPNEFMFFVETEKGDRNPQDYFYDALYRLNMLKGRAFESEYFNNFLSLFSFGMEIRLKGERD
jgi:putative nucleotidyltransferase with HDIG domain